MFIKEIRRPEPPRPRSIVEEVKERILNTEHAPNDYHYNRGTMYMDKLAYTNWLERVVRPQFPKGSLCTLAYRMTAPKSLPDPIMSVEDLQEVNWMAPCDDSTRKPKCVHLRNVTYPQIMLIMSPAMLRPLTDEELKLVHLRNQAKELLAQAIQTATEPEATPEPSEADPGSYAG